MLLLSKYAPAASETCEQNSCLLANQVPAAPFPIHKCVRFWFFCALSAEPSSDEHTNLSVAPSEVRLITLPGDQYKWLFLPEKKHLFEKPLSKLNTSAYREICTAIGHSIEVRRKERETTGPNYAIRESSFALVGNTESSISPTFTSTIEALKRRNASLATSTQSLCATVKARDQVIATLQQQCVTLQEQVRVLGMQLDCNAGQLRMAEQRCIDSESSRMKIQERISRCRDAADDLLKELQ